MRVLFVLFLLSLSANSFAQPVPKDEFINTKEGTSLASKRVFFNECKKWIKGGENTPEAAQICACIVSKLDGHYTDADLKALRKAHGNATLSMLMEKDSFYAKMSQDCYGRVWDKSMLFTAQQIAAVKESLKEGIRKSAKDSIDEKRLDAYCDCAVKTMKERKINTSKWSDLSDPNSFLYNEIAYRCGRVPVKNVSQTSGWTAALAADVHGPDRDTVHVITVDAMTKLKVKLGPFTYIWLLDSGATDLLISDSLAVKMMEKNVFSAKDFLGTGTYTIANGKTVDCKIYRVNNVQIGKYTLDNMMLSVAKDADVFLLGKSFLNKFRRWTVDNQEELLILER
ncbi:gag-polyprotein putative aspartyl protease [Chitinophaga sp. YR627]|uniref:retropepsin-like aspartic protease n=1 Tax=Chitinophaga sp. YR627 TaxID=1881041 RepID=UPI0008E53B44|nr:retropepsin-like aspartic protease [Chitinophaga sp. YR627]SFO74671.1 gag-polyprotein putative aspartyl protease [Chitinophaga sp. YR627]